MELSRVLSKTLEKQLFKGKTLIVIGSRQVGKTTLINHVIQHYESFLFLDGDDSQVRQILSNNNTAEIKQIIGNHKIVFIDEAQRINHIGLTAKIIHDQFKDVQLILSGSSALELNNAVNETLTGRKLEYHLYPISWGELVAQYGYLKSLQNLNNRLIYGMYPDIIINPGQEKEFLKNLTESYLYKDILALGNIKKPDVLERLLQALAYQIGSEVSYNELSSLLGVAKETIISYIQLLEKAYIVFRVDSFSKNLRNEIKNSKKIYFYDNGIRNAIINAFNPIDIRPDKGVLWENFLISERIKHLEYHNIYCKYYFWRTKGQQEIDWIEIKDLKINAYEFKWKGAEKVKFPNAFVEAYQPDLEAVDKTNFNVFLGGV
jgi:predicted AAA+ superfamily ATPase